MPSRNGHWKTVTGKPLLGVDARKGVHDCFGVVRPMGLFLGYIGYGGAQYGQSQGMGPVGKVDVGWWGHGKDLHIRDWGEGCLSRLLLSGLSSLQFTIGSDEEESGSALAPAQFHVEEECGILSPVPRFADLLQDKGPASLRR